jgi:hypothetical protein
MSQSGRPHGFWRTALLLCLAFFGLAFVPQSAITDRVNAEGTVFSLQRGTPAAIPNFVDLVAGCNWSGIGGQVFDQIGSPMTGLMVKVSGTLEGRQVLFYVYTGSSQHFGPGGYDLKFADQPVASLTLNLQLLDAAGVPLSKSFVVPTYDACQQNLLVVNLAPISVDHPVYLPLVSR